MSYAIGVARPINITVYTEGTATPQLWRYYWDTIEACIAPETVLQALRDAGFESVQQRLELGIFSEYTASKAQ